MWMSTDEAKTLEPQQERSRVTRRRIVAAANRLLKVRAFGSLSVQEISKEAGCSIGAFYGRFQGKDDLVGPLLERHYRGTLRGLRRAIASPGWRAMTLEDRLAWATRMAVWAFRSRRWLIRALAVSMRQDGHKLTEAQKKTREQFTVMSRELLIDFADEIAHANRAGAIDFALFLISTLCRERVLFGELSDGAWVADTDDALVREVTRTAHAYLTGGAEARGLWLGA